MDSTMEDPNSQIKTHNATMARMYRRHVQSQKRQRSSEVSSSKTTKRTPTPDPIT
ncbi:hypothetical protein CASFOL_039265 [Castilleja foliolosa]|uniref:DET1- and DDB1-associated protein 1 n=1 Tax=Castilleja foliolosa TaxID=1961234 RepID=A0ABD3BIM0_9LAMI